jgi:chemotaxis protein methyltransferase CheR
MQMGRSVSEEDLARLSDFVAERMGLYFPRDRWRDLERGLNSAVRESTFNDCATYIEWLLSAASTRSQVESLASHLTVGETYFFRDRKVFEALEELVLPELIRSRRREARKHLRIWSAGCATGEEPYSLAILISKMMPDLHDWHVTILATDINPRFLQKAVDGLYGNWSFRDVPSGIRQGFFKQKGKGRFEVLPRIKNMVTFSYLNLADDPYPSLFNKSNAMDLIFCRNVLMYFSPERAKQVVHNLRRALVDGGYLVPSPGEASHVLFADFAVVHSPGAILYRNERRQCPAALALSRESAGGPGAWFTPVAEDLAGRPIEEQPVGDELAMTADPRMISGLETQDSDPETRIPELETRNPQPETQLQDLYRQSLVLYAEGCYAEAAEKAEGLLVRDPSYAPGMILLARAYANAGELAKALAWCENAVASEKLNAQVHYLMATVLQELDHTEAAASSFKRALYLDPNLIVAHVALGNLSRQGGRLEESGKHFANALSLLSAKPPEHILPESDGMTIQRLIEIIRSTMSAI